VIELGNERISVGKSQIFERLTYEREDIISIEDGQSASKKKRKSRNSKEDVVGYRPFTSTEALDILLEEIERWVVLPTELASQLTPLGTKTSARAQKLLPGFGS
jgi:hypothetical protein